MNLNNTDEFKKQNDINKNEINEISKYIDLFVCALIC